MNYIFVLFIAISLKAYAEPVTQQNFLNISVEQEDCVFNYVRSIRVDKKSALIQKPQVVYSHQIDLQTYQAEFQSLQGFLTDAFLNYFNNMTEKVFLYTGWDLYRGERTPLDSLAHEFTHFFQFVESGRDKDLQKNDSNDDLETEAVVVQTKFRDLKICR